MKIKLDIIYKWGSYIIYYLNWVIFEIEEEIINNYVKIIGVLFWVFYIENI